MKEYIEREALLRLMGKPPSIAVPTDSELRLIKCAISTLENFPAADVREVVRGKWVGNKRHQSCSECHMTYCVPDGQSGELDMMGYHFCPNCGADMREANDGT